jgi:hypothetical protein
MERHWRVVIEHSAASPHCSLPKSLGVYCSVLECITIETTDPAARKRLGYEHRCWEVGMEDHDFRVIEARAALAEAHKRVPSDLGLEELREEITRFRKYVRWLIDLADDAADTEYDEEVSQLMIYGGICIAPADTFKLCDNCTQMLDLVRGSGSGQGNTCRAPASADSAA